MQIENFSLMYPEGKSPSYMTLGEECCNDLSLDYICDSITESEYEQNVIKRMMTRLEHDPETISYRCDVFEDILRFPSLREKIKELLEQLDPGDYVMVHAGVAIAKITSDDDEEADALLDDLL